MHLVGSSAMRKIIAERERNVRGPIVIGHSSHFGLGQFAAAEVTEEQGSN